MFEQPSNEQVERLHVGMFERRSLADAGRF